MSKRLTHAQINRTGRMFREKSDIEIYNELHTMNSSASLNELSSHNRDD